MITEIFDVKIPISKNSGHEEIVNLLLAMLILKNSIVDSEHRIDCLMDVIKKYKDPTQSHLLVESYKDDGIHPSPTKKQKLYN